MKAKDIDADRKPAAGKPETSSCWATKAVLASGVGVPLGIVAAADPAAAFDFGAEAPMSFFADNNSIEPVSLDSADDETLTVADSESYGFPAFEAPVADQSINIIDHSFDVTANIPENYVSLDAQNPVLPELAPTQVATDQDGLSQEYLDFILADAAPKTDETAIDLIWHTGQADEPVIEVAAADALTVEPVTDDRAEPVPTLDTQQTHVADDTEPGFLKWLQDALPEEQAMTPPIGSDGKSLEVARSAIVIPPLIMWATSAMGLTIAATATVAVNHADTPSPSVSWPSIRTDSTLAPLPEPASPVDNRTTLSQADLDQIYEDTNSFNATQMPTISRPGTGAGDNVFTGTPLVLVEAQNPPGISIEDQLFSNIPGFTPAAQELAKGTGYPASSQDHLDNTLYSKDDDGTGNESGQSEPTRDEAQKDLEILEADEDRLWRKYELAQQAIKNDQSNDELYTQLDTAMTAYLDAANLAYEARKRIDSALGIEAGVDDPASEHSDDSQQVRPPSQTNVHSISLPPSNVTTQEPHAANDKPSSVSRLSQHPRRRAQRLEVLAEAEQQRLQELTDAQAAAQTASENAKNGKGSLKVALEASGPVVRAQEALGDARRVLRAAGRTPKTEAEVATIKARWEDTVAETSRKNEDYKTALKVRPHNDINSHKQRQAHEALQKATEEQQEAHEAYLDATTPDPLAED